MVKANPPHSLEPVSRGRANVRSMANSRSADCILAFPMCTVSSREIGRHGVVQTRFGAGVGRSAGFLL
jgi:hypothetical protein